MSSVEELKKMQHINGSVFIRTTTKYTGNFKYIYVHTSTVFATLTDATRAGDSVTGTFAAGQELYGNFTEIVLTSGAIMAYS